MKDQLIPIMVQAFIECADDGHCSEGCPHINVDMGRRRPYRATGTCSLFLDKHGNKAPLTLNMERMEGHDIRPEFKRRMDCQKQLRIVAHE